MQATYSADLAEFYEGDKEYDTGTVLIFGGEKEVTISTQAFDHRVAGVVSDDAAFSMYGACPGFKNQIALQGRVPCKVVGKVQKGDLIVTSNIPGVAMSAKNNAASGTIIGKSLEDYNSDHIGTIEVAVGRT
jgi:trimeric autotransporter adhesin